MSVLSFLIAGYMVVSSVCTVLFYAACVSAKRAPHFCHDDLTEIASTEAKMLRHSLIAPSTAAPTRAIHWI
jgi:hypothetical protein